MSGGGPRLVLLARLAEAGCWDDAVRRHETDPWAYLRRKLEATAEPLRTYKLQIFEDAKKRLLEDLRRPMLPPGALESHREAFESLLSIGDYADLAFHLTPGGDPESRREGAAAILSSARAPTVFDHESLPAERRSRAWEKRVTEMAERLDLKTLTALAERGPMTAAKKARLARRLRRNLREYLTVASGDGALREEITPFMLSRIETAIAASLRLLGRWR